MIAVIALFASYIQSVTGFGFGIFAMIFLPGILAYPQANLLSSLLSTLTSVSVAAVMLRKTDFKNLIFPVIGCIFSTFISVAFIKTQKNQTMILLLGIALFVLSVYFFFFSDKIKIRPTWYAGLFAGAVSGIMSGMFAVGGPPVVVYFMQSEDDKDAYLATISAYFVFSGIIAITAKSAAGFAGADIFSLILAGIVGMALGSFAGKLTRDAIKPQMIKKAVYGVMAVSGIVNIVNSII